MDGRRNFNRWGLKRSIITEGDHKSIKALSFQISKHNASNYLVTDT
jgi:hypothetical protein